MNQFEQKYFQKRIEQPLQEEFEIEGEILPLNTLYDEVNKSLLDLFINRVVSIKDAYAVYEQLDREDGFQDRWVVQIKEPKQIDSRNSFVWTDFEGECKEIHKILCEKGRTYNPKISDWNSDLYILAKTSNMWFYFVYDGHRYCRMGRFITDVSEETVMEDFKELFTSVDDGVSVTHIPLHYFG